MNADYDNELNIEYYTNEAETATDSTTRLDKMAIAHSGDEIDQALASMPVKRAPQNTLSRIMLNIATIPQLELDAAALSIGVMPARIIRYTPPVIKNLENVAASDLEELDTNRAGQFNPLGYVFIGLWLSLCLFGLYLIWPGISSLIFGPPNDSDGLARLQALQNWWGNFSGNAIGFFNTIQPYLPTIVSAVAGVVLMLYFINQQRRRLWM